MFEISKLLEIIGFVNYGNNIVYWYGESSIILREKTYSFISKNIIFGGKNEELKDFLIRTYPKEIRKYKINLLFSTS